MRSSMVSMLGAAATVAAAPSYVMYFDQWHKDSLPDKSVTAGVNYVITSFATSDLFVSGGTYTPFMPLDQVRALFDAGTKVCMAIGGWGDTAGFSTGSASEQSRQTYAANIAATLDRLGYDCVDVDWEYPGGNGQDYRQIPNDQKVQEIDNYPLLLKAIKEAIGTKELSIAVPARPGDMIAYTKEKVPEINKYVDHVNVMTYDLMNRRDNVTAHHTSVKGSAQAIDIYIERGMDASKLILGFPFYAKWFTTKAGVSCSAPTGCETAVLELPDGSDPGLSGAVTFEVANWVQGSDFVNAVTNGQEDAEEGGQWYWDAAKGVYWTWDTPKLIARKFEEIVKAKGLGGVMAWSLAQDSHDWSRFKALQEGVKGLSSNTPSPSSSAGVTPTATPIGTPTSTSIVTPTTTAIVSPTATPTSKCGRRRK
ncbi:unnamed protein product [Clonostachys rhizophaga]|uniref:chitinase n=1 Tax=Clonostachys rhizophaga TaxID=160324 RepID=A0A9N9VA75_9HYPO|nr:unnamed protein product [Clonostachys rhizophaga]